MSNETKSYPGQCLETEVLEIQPPKIVSRMRKASRFLKSNTHVTAIGRDGKPFETFIASIQAPVEVMVLLHDRNIVGIVVAEGEPNIETDIKVTMEFYDSEHQFLQDYIWQSDSYSDEE